MEKSQAIVDIFNKKRVKKYEPNSEKTRFGYPVYSSKDEGLDEYFKNSPDVSGMVWGGGANNSSKDLPKGFVVNPYNEYMKDPQKREALYRNEASRILMDSQPAPEYRISPELQKWRENTFKPGDPYRENDQAFRETVIARILTGDSGSDRDNPMPMEPETLEISSAYGKMLDDRGNLEKKQEFNRTFRKPILGQNRGIMRSATR